MSWSRLLMIVSIAICDLPVWRSPMISSRWPRPIGVIASIALMPVCSGSCTGLRPMIPGAWISIRRRWAPIRSPLPSTGSPRALTTRPSTPSPTGTERIRPVDLTVWPSSISSTSPRTTAPIESSSRFRARPAVPSSNSSSSFTAASGSPETRAMPSPTSETRPTVRASSDGVKPSRFDLSAAAMSAAESVSSAMWWFLGRLSRFVLEAGLQLFEPGAYGAVDHGVADRGDEAAEHARVDDHLDAHAGTGGVGERGAQAVELVGREVDGAAHLGHLLVFRRRGALHEAIDDRRQVAGAARPDHHRDQLHGGRRRLAAEQVLDDRLPAGGPDRVVGERRAQLVAALVRAGEAEQLVLDLVEGALGAGHLEQAPGVAVDARVVVAHDRAPAATPVRPTSAMNSSIRRCCVAASSVSATTRSSVAEAWPAMSLRSSSDDRLAAAAMS